jgi:hypothetical protein
LDSPFFLLLLLLPLAFPLFRKPPKKSDFGSLSSSSSFVATEIALAVDTYVHALH